MLQFIESVVGFSYKRLQCVIMNIEVGVYTSGFRFNMFKNSNTPNYIGSNYFDS